MHSIDEIERRTGSSLCLSDQLRAHANKLRLHGRDRLADSFDEQATAIELALGKIESAIDRLNLHTKMDGQGEKEALVDASHQGIVSSKGSSTYPNPVPIATSYPQFAPVSLSTSVLNQKPQWTWNNPTVSSMIPHGDKCKEVGYEQANE